MPDLDVNLLEPLRRALFAVLIPLPFFALLALVVKRRRLLSDVKRAAPEIRVNLLIHTLDATLVAPVLAIIAVTLSGFFRGNGLSVLPPSLWDNLHPALVAVCAVFMGDFIGYWRHRLEHSPLLWPSHAVHHSDTQMTWLAIFRFHPINRLSTTLIDFSFLLALGLPAYALLVNALVRHYYGALIHANLPWTYGPLKHVFVSPAMHRWHHANNPTAYNTNFASVFSIFDKMFGTFRVPGECRAPLGVCENMGHGVLGQLLHPFKPSAYARSGKHENSVHASDA